MNILHLLSQNHLTGAEVYAVELIKHQKADGHRLFQISNGFFTPTQADKVQLSVEERSTVKFLKNVFFLRKFLTKNNIQVIHTHSRAAAKLAYWARLGLSVGMVSTVHGRQHPSLSKRLMNQYGDFIIPVCESIRAQLQNDFGYSFRRMKVIRNPIASDRFPFAERKPNLTPKIAIVGRTTGPKGERSKLFIEALIPWLQKANKEADIVLVGGKLSDLRLQSSASVTAVHALELDGKIYGQFDLVVGSGRVAMESISSGIPTIAFGEASYRGLVTKNNLEENLKTNFGDIEPNSHRPTLIAEQFSSDLSEFFSGKLTSEKLSELSSIVKKEFDSKLIARKVNRIYESAYFLRQYSKWIPVLMYHKIPKTEIESQHKIFVTEQNFQKHLEFYKSRGFETLTFGELKRYKSGALNFSQFPKKPLILTFDDGYVDNLENASPLLKQFGFKAQLFLLADMTINKNQWDVSETEKPHEIVSGSARQKWLTSQFEIGSHGFRHRKITQMSEAEAREELSQSKLALEAEFKIDVPVYAFTYGDTNSNAAEWALEAGYDYAVNTDTGGLILEENPYEVFRVNIFPGETKSSLYKKTSSWYRSYYFRKRKQ